MEMSVFTWQHQKSARSEIYVVTYISCIESKCSPFKKHKNNINLLPLNGDKHNLQSMKLNGNKKRKCKCNVLAVKEYYLHCCCLQIFLLIYVLNFLRHCLNSICGIFDSFLGRLIEYVLLFMEETFDTFFLKIIQTLQVVLFQK